MGLTQGATIQLDLNPPSDGSPRQKVAVRPRSSSSSSSSSSGGVNGSGNNVEPELLPLYSNGDPIAGEVRESLFLCNASSNASCRRRLREREVETRGEEERDEEKPSSRWFFHRFQLSLFSSSQP